MLKETYKISTGPIPSITITLAPDQTVFASTGSFLAGPPSLEQETEIFRSSSKRGAGSFLLSGESLFINKYTNKGEKAANLILSDEQIGTVVPVKEELNEGLLCLSGAFIASTSEIDVGLKQVRNFAQASLTGQSLWMQYCKNKNPENPSTVFLMAATQPARIKLAKEEIELIDNRSLFAMTKGVKLHLFENEGLKKALGGGEGRFMTVVEGPGTVWIAPRRRRAGKFIDQIVRFIRPE